MYIILYLFSTSQFYFLKITVYSISVQIFFLLCNSFLEILNLSLLLHLWTVQTGPFTWNTFSTYIVFINLHFEIVLKISPNPVNYSINFPGGSDGKASPWVRSLGQEDPLEKEITTHSSTLAWKIPWMEESSRLQSMGLQRVGHDWMT